MELMGTHFSLTLGAWRLRFSLAIEDTDLQAPATAMKAETPLRLAPGEKLDRIFPNRR